jgi:hypothetical protein
MAHNDTDAASSTSPLAWAQTHWRPSPEQAPFREGDLLVVVAGVLVPGR